jgi:hypothetical protein
VQAVQVLLEQRLQLGPPPWVEELLQPKHVVITSVTLAPFCCNRLSCVTNVERTVGAWPTADRHASQQMQL